MSNSIWALSVSTDVALVRLIDNPALEHLLLFAFSYIVSTS